MNILHITPHMGGGIGTVIMGWMDRVIAANDHDQRVYCLDTINHKALRWAMEKGFGLYCSGSKFDFWKELATADIVLVHYWDHPTLKELLSKTLPPCRLVFWCHKNIPYTDQEIFYPDLWIDTSPIQGHGRYIWSTGDISRFLKIKPQAHEGFNIGTVATYIGNSPKLHPSFTDMCGIIKHRIPEARFTILGDWKEVKVQDPSFNYVDHVDDVAPYLAEMDVFGYPLRPDHWGTCEQVLGEAMAAGVVPVTMNNPAERLIVEDGISGFIGHTAQHYIDHFNYLFNNHRRFSSEVRKWAKELYSLDAMIRKWDEVFEEMMARPKTVRYPL